MEINAKRLILGLLLAAEGRSISVTSAIGACAVFGISENSVRVTLTRLSAEERIESTGRGTYRLGPAARHLSDAVGTWRRAEERLRAWQGDFLVAYTAVLGRRNRPHLRRRERALALLGFRELARGLYVRPNNIDRDEHAVRERLFDLGLERESVVFAGACFDLGHRQRIDTLWNREALNAHYIEDGQRLTEWMKRAPLLEREVAARESYLLGSQAIRSVVYDPWLPPPFVDSEARHAYFETVCRFDEVGRDIWRRFASSLKHWPAPETDMMPTRH